MFQYVEHKHDESNTAYPQAESKTSHHFCINYLFNTYSYLQQPRKVQQTISRKQQLRAERKYAQNAPQRNILIHLPI
jgi:hypothetical protein